MSVISVLLVGTPIFLIGLALVADYKGVRNSFARGSDRGNTSDLKYHAPIIAGGIFFMVMPGAVIVDAVIRHLF
ncbi:hypothetical protein [Streptomyces sp900116325]|uniref:hypothetical protein n=1 Tax=Streptomyces sp. 900116325 TaxID=3154295 RepID=UPI003401B07A